MQAIILTGGLGTRLRSVVPNLPKPMAPIENKPFLAYLLDYLKTNGFTDIVLSVGYLKECIQDYFGTHYNDMKIRYSVEEQPLGTGGAIQYSLKQTDHSQPVFVLNGDTFVTLDYKAMLTQHLNTKATLTVALRELDDCARYGKVQINNNYINAFTEKGEAGAGLINAGVYLLNAALFGAFYLPEQFSFERDFLYPHIHNVKPHYFISDNYFIDIGIPEDYARARLELAQR